uniref:Uncharacterized protein n=1 Tax=Oryza sativa subsp. japonica TaxID=39947 RepID=Q94HP5_ORYSJ|nr:Hypothetical protein [Oryza sativa Japonica Group]
MAAPAPLQRQEVGWLRRLRGRRWRRRWFAVLTSVGVRREERMRRRKSSRCDRLLPLHRCALLRESSFDFSASFSAAQRVECLRVSQQAEALGRISYKEGENLFGAPYDSRYVAAPPGMPAMAFDAYTADLRCLVEHASRKNGGKPVIPVTHSKGSLMAAEFLTRSATPRFVKHLVMVSTGAGGIVVAMQSLAASAYAAPGSLARTERSYGTVFAALPSPNVFGGAPLVVTRRRNYSAHDISEFLPVVRFSGEEVKLYRTRALPVNSGLRAPRVTMTAVYGASVPTPEQLVYWDGDFSKAPEVVYGDGDGDGAVNLESVLAWNTVVGHDLEQGFFKAVKIMNATCLHPNLVPMDEIGENCQSLESIEFLSQGRSDRSFSSSLSVCAVNRPPPLRECDTSSTAEFAIYPSVFRRDEFHVCFGCAAEINPYNSSTAVAYFSLDQFD